MINLIKVHLFVFCSTMMLILSCSDTIRQGNEEELKPQKMKPASSYLDTVFVHSPAAVFYTPDSMQLESIKAITEPGIFEGTMHDCFYQMRNSRNVLEQYYSRVKTIEIKNARYIRFKKSDGLTDYVDLNALNDPCGVIIFDGRQEPRLVDMTNIETELGFYFTQ